MFMQERLGSLTNKCMDSGADDMEYYIQEGAHILGMQEHAHSAKVNLLHIVNTCSLFEHLSALGLFPLLIAQPIVTVPADTQ